MKKTFLLSITILLFVLSFNTAFASFSFILTNDYEAGNTDVVFNLALTTDETLTVNPYQFEFTYDSSELEFVSYSNIPLGGLVANGVGPAYADASAGTVNRFTVGGDIVNWIFSASVNENTYTTIGTFTFNLTENARADGEDDFGFDYNDDMFALIVNDTSYSTSFNSLESITSKDSGFTFDVGTSSVPVPSTLFLISAGVLGLAGLKRKFT
jgi:hypothetical protein